MATPQQVINAARSHLGTPWQHQGRLPGVALDCAGLIIMVARELELVTPDFDINGYSRRPDGSMLEWCDLYMQRIGAIELGAVLVVATSQDPQHMGIVGDYLHGGFSFIHSSNTGRPAQCIETRLMFAKNMQQRGIYRLPRVV